MRWVDGDTEEELRAKADSQPALEGQADGQMKEGTAGELHC